MSDTSPPPPTTEPPSPLTLVGEPGFNYSALTALGMAAYQVAEAGEVATATAGIGQAMGAAAASSQGDPSVVFGAILQAYVDGFLAMGERVAGRVAAAQEIGDDVTVAACSLRASQYYAQALFYVLGTSTPQSETEVFASVKKHWLRFLAHAPAQMEELTVSHRGVAMPAWLLRPRGFDGPRPTLMLTNGSDGQSADMWSYGAAAALERGWNAVIYEGPGQGGMVFENGMSFVPDWETVVTPIVDALVARDDVDADRIVLAGLSMGGNLVVRAAAFEHRLAALVCMPGVVQPWLGFPADLRNVVATDGESEDADRAATNQAWAAATAGQELKSFEKFLLAKRFEPFSAEALDAARRGTVLTDLYTPARTMMSMDVTAVAGDITCPTLVLDYEGEQFYAGQPRRLFDLLTGVQIKDYVVMEAADGAQLHCSPLAPQHHNEVIFDWLYRRAELR